MLEPLTFQGLPLSALRQPDVRRRAIETFLRSLQRAGAERATAKRIWRWSAGGAAAGDDDHHEDNKPVRVAKLAEFVCKTLAPSAARLICAGAAPGDGDASLYQRFAGLADADRLKDVEPNAASLAEYLTNRPDLYHVVKTTTKGGWLSSAKEEYSVAFAELVIE